MNFLLLENGKTIRLLRAGILPAVKKKIKMQAKEGKVYDRRRMCYNYHFANRCSAGFDNGNCFCLQAEKSERRTASRL